MTVKECYEIAVGFLPESPSDNTEMQKFMVPWCNVLLADSVNHENVFRRVNKIKELDKPLKVSAQSDEIPYNEKLVSMAFPYGMARWIFRENDDISGSREYYNLYAAALEEATPLEFTELKDVYG
ncbi:MAG: hypothetical protein IKJ82_03000 [Oscillospiraceae bacterium]|nr:hypothetical protein [Oscillospiraceae bacterium]